MVNIKFGFASDFDYEDEDSTIRPHTPSSNNSTTNGAASKAVNGTASGTANGTANGNNGNNGHNNNVHVNNGNYDHTPCQNGSVTAHNDPAPGSVNGFDSPSHYSSAPAPGRPSRGSVSFPIHMRPTRSHSNTHSAQPRPEPSQPFEISRQHMRQLGPPQGAPGGPPQKHRGGFCHGAPHAFPQGPAPPAPPAPSQRPAHGTSQDYGGIPMRYDSFSTSSSSASRSQPSRSVPKPPNTTPQPPTVADGSSSRGRRPARSQNQRWRDNDPWEAPSSQWINRDDAPSYQQSPEQPPRQPPRQPARQHARQSTQHQSQNQVHKRRSGSSARRQSGSSARRRSYKNLVGGYGDSTNGGGNVTYNGFPLEFDPSMQGNHQGSGPSFGSGGTEFCQLGHNSSGHNGGGQNLVGSAFFVPGQTGSNPNNNNGYNSYYYNNSSNNNSSNNNSSNNSNSYNNAVPDGFTPLSSAPMSRNTTNGQSLRSSMTGLSLSAPAVGDQISQRAHTASVEDDGKFTVPKKWYIEKKEELKKYLDSFSALKTTFRRIFTIEVQGHKIGHKDGHINLIVIKADPINKGSEPSDALLLINNVLKQGNHNIASMKQARRNGTKPLRPDLEMEHIDIFMPRLINVSKLGKAAFTTTSSKGLSLEQIIESARHPKAMFAPQRAAVTLHSEYGIRLDKVYDGRLFYEDSEKRKWIEQMHTETGVIDMQLLDSALRLEESKEFEKLPPIVHLKPWHAVVGSRLVGWTSSSLDSGEQNNTPPRTAEFDPAIRIRLMGEVEDMPFDLLPDSPLKLKMSYDVATQHLINSHAVTRCSNADDERPYTGNNLFCNVASTPNETCEVDLARYFVRKVVYLSHLFCILNAEMHRTHPRRYYTEIHLDDVRAHTRKRINLAIRTGGINDPIFGQSPWNAEWEHQCGHFAKFEKPYIPSKDGQLETQIHGPNSQQANTTSAATTTAAPTNGVAMPSSNAAATDAVLLAENAVADQVALTTTSNAPPASAETADTAQTADAAQTAVADTAAGDEAPPSSPATAQDAEGLQDSEALDEQIT